MEGKDNSDSLWYRINKRQHEQPFVEFVTEVRGEKMLDWQIGKLTGSLTAEERNARYYYSPDKGSKTSTVRSRDRKAPQNKRPRRGR